MSCQFFIIKKTNRTPRDLSKIIEWAYGEIPEEPYDSRILCKPLKKCYFEALEKYPALNGPDRVKDENLIDKAIEYNLSPHVILLDCAWSKAEEIYSAMHPLAYKYGLCLYRYDSFYLESKPEQLIERFTLEEYEPSGKAFIKSAILPTIACSSLTALYIHILKEPVNLPFPYNFSIPSWFSYIFIIFIAMWTYAGIYAGMLKRRRCRKSSVDIEYHPEKTDSPEGMVQS